MNARMAGGFLLAFGLLAACDKPATRDLPPAKRLAPEGTVFLLRAVSIADETTLHGFPEGAAARLLEKRGRTVLVEIDGTKLEIEAEDVTNDLDVRDAALSSGARSGRSSAQQRKSEDQTATPPFRTAVEDNPLRAQVKKLRGEISAAQAEIQAVYDARRDSIAGYATRHYSQSAGGKPGSRQASGSPADSPENVARQKRIDDLRRYIVQREEEIRELESKPEY